MNQRSRLRLSALPPSAFPLQVCSLAILHAGAGMTGGACRFQPTCSEYAAIAVHEHGIVRGSWLALRRVLRCPLGVPVALIRFRPEVHSCRVRFPQLPQRGVHFIKRFKIIGSILGRNKKSQSARRGWAGLKHPSRVLGRSFLSCFSACSFSSRRSPATPAPEKTQQTATVPSQPQPASAPDASAAATNTAQAVSRIHHGR